MSRRMTFADVIAAEGFTPYNATNPNGYITGTYFNTTIPPLAAPRDSPTITGPFSFAGSGSIAGSLSIAGALSLAGAATAITDTGTAASWQLLISAVNNTLGASIKLLGDGATTPSKTLRVDSGVFQIVNDANTATLLTLTDAGVLNLPVSPTVPTPAAGDSSTKAATTAFVATGLNAVSNIGRNRVHNPLFRINQRATASITTASGYVADRWFVTSTNGTRTVQIFTMSDADRAAIGDEDATAGVNYVTTGGSAAGDFEFLQHRVESVRTFAGKTVTLSFWAIASLPGKFIAIDLAQIFGTGGSPSVSVTAIGSTKFALSQIWARYSVTIAVPNVQGKTLGTNGDDYLQVAIWLSAGSSFNARNGSLGPQTVNASFWGVQLEAGSAATALEKRSYRQELTDCQRYFQTGRMTFVGYQVAASGAGYMMMPPVPFRATPTITITSTSGITNATGQTLTYDPSGALYLLGTATATGSVVLVAVYTASADL